MPWQHCLDSTSQQILQQTQAEFVSKAESIEDQLPPLYAEQEKLQDQISIVEECIEDYIASMTEGLLHGFAYQRANGDTNPFRAEWQVGTSYSFGDFVQVTQGDSPFGYEYYLCILSNVGDVDDNKPGQGTSWLTYWFSWGTTPLTHPPYDVVLGPNYNNKVYGQQLTDFQITDSTATDYYHYNGGLWFGLNTDVDNQISTNHSDWGAGNDLVTRPFLENALWLKS